MTKNMQAAKARVQLIQIFLIALKLLINSVVAQLHAESTMHLEMLQMR